MPLDSLLRFDLLGTAVLAALPGVLVVRYVLSRQLSRVTINSRSLGPTEQSTLQQRYETAGLPDIETLVATGVGELVAGLSGTPGRRLLVLSETVLETATDEELTGLVGIVAGQHEERLLEWYSGVLVFLGAAFAVALGVDPSGFRSTLARVLLVLFLVSVPFTGFALLRRKTFAADTIAVSRVGKVPVRAAIELVGTDRLPDWVPDPVRPKPSVEERLRRL